MEKPDLPPKAERPHDSFVDALVVFEVDPRVVAQLVTSVNIARSWNVVVARSDELDAALQIDLQANGMAYERDTHFAQVIGIALSCIALHWRLDYFLVYPHTQAALHSQQRFTSN